MVDTNQTRRWITAAAQPVDECRTQMPELREGDLGVSQAEALRRARVARQQRAVGAAKVSPVQAALVGMVEPPRTRSDRQRTVRKPRSVQPKIENLGTSRLVCCRQARALPLIVRREARREMPATWRRSRSVSKDTPDESAAAALDFALADH